MINMRLHRLLLCLLLLISMGAGMVQGQDAPPPASEPAPTATELPAQEPLPTAAPATATATPEMTATLPPTVTATPEMTATLPPTATNTPEVTATLPPTATNTPEVTATLPPTITTTTTTTPNMTATLPTTITATTTATTTTTATVTATPEEALPGLGLQSCTVQAGPTVAELIAAFNTALSTTQPDTVCLAAGATYTFDTLASGWNLFDDGLSRFSVLPVISSDIIVEGHGATLHYPPHNTGVTWHAFIVGFYGNLTVRNVRITGMMTAYAIGNLSVENSSTTGMTATISNDKSLRIVNSTVNGGISTSRPLIISGSTFENNQFTNVISTGGPLTISDSVFRNNTMQVITAGRGPINITRSRFENNRSDPVVHIYSGSTHSITDSVFTGTRINTSSGGSAVIQVGGHVGLTFQNNCLYDNRGFGDVPVSVRVDGWNMNNGSVNLNGNWWGSIDAAASAIPAGVSFLTMPILGCPPTPLVATDQGLTLAAGQPVSFTLGQSSGLPPFTYSVVTPPAQGTLSGSGSSYTYTPAAGFTGQDELIFMVTATATGQTATARVRFFVGVPPQPHIFVNSTAQEVPALTNGNCTLGEALRAAATNVAVDACAAGNPFSVDAIALQPGTYPLTVADHMHLDFSYSTHGPAFGLPAITGPTYIEGSGATILGASVGFGLLRVANTGSLTVANATLQNGVTGFAGGAIYSEGPLELRNVTLRGNRAAAGGAISSSRPLTIHNSRFEQNFAGSGGAIYVDSTMLTVSDSIFDRNQAHNRASAIYLESRFRSSPWPSDFSGRAAEAIITGSRFLGNSVTGTTTTGAAIQTNQHSHQPNLTTLNISGGCLVGNSPADIEATGFQAIRALSNWWGSITGPRTGGYLVYPLLTTPPAGCPVLPPVVNTDTIRAVFNAPVNFTVPVTGGLPPYSYTLVSPTTRGTLSGTLPDLTYTPDAPFRGQDFFEVRVSNASGETTTARLMIFVDSTLRATPLSRSLKATEPAALTLSGTDGIPPYSYSIYSTPRWGTLSGTPPNVTYTPQPGFVGSDSFQFNVTDALGAVRTGEVRLTVTHDLTAQNSTVTVPQGIPTTIVPQATGEFPPFTYSIITPPWGGTFTGTPPQLVYTTLTNITGPRTLNFRVTDSRGYTSVGTITLNIVIPLRAQSQWLRSADAQQLIDVSTGTLGGTLGGTPPYTYSHTLPQYGTVTRGTGSQFIYTRTPGTTALDQFDITVTDSVGQAVTVTAYLSTAPQLQNTSAAAVTTTYNTDVLLPLATEGGVPPYTYSITRPPANGTISGTPNMIYTPRAGFSGTDSVVYTVTDAEGFSSSASLTITVLPEPALVIPPVTADYNTPVDISFTVTGALPPYILTVGTPAQGTVSFDDTGNTTRVRYTPNSETSGSDSFSITLTDVNGTSMTGTASVTVRGPLMVPAGDSAALIQAITTASASPGADVIILGGGTYTLTSVHQRVTIDNISIAFGLPTVRGRLEIRGDGSIIQSIIQHSPSAPPFGLFHASVAQLTLRQLTLSGIGNIPISSSGTLVLDAVTVRDTNLHTAIRHTGSLVVRNSRLLNNSQAVELSGGPLTIENSIISGNLRGISLLAPHSRPATVTITGSCITGNNTAGIQAPWHTTGVVAGNWWGSPDGPNMSSNRVTAADYSTIVDTAPLSAPLPGCLMSPESTVQRRWQQAGPITLEVSGGTAPYSFQVSGTPTGGTVSGTAPNLTFTPDAGFSGTGEVLYRVQDATGMVTRGRVRVMVAPDLISPPRPVNAVPGQPVNLTLTASGGREPYTFSNLSRPANGTLTGTAPDLTFTPANGFSSSTSFTFTVTDANGDTVTGRANITVARLAAASRTLTLLAGQDVALSLTATGGIPPYRFRQLTTPVGGVLVGQSPALRYLANGNFSGVETLSFEAQDSQDTTVTFTITITVNRPAATIPVTTTAMETPLVNNGNCTLLEALLAAHNNSAVDACPAGSTGMDVVELPAGLFNIQVNPVDTWVGNGSRLTLRGAGTEQTVIRGYYDRPFMTTWLSSSETIFTGISFEGWPRGIVDGTGSVTLDTVRVNTAGARMRTAMVRMPGGEPGRLTVRNSIFISRDLESFQPALLTRDPVVTTITGSAFSMTYDIMRVSHATLTHNCLLGLYPNRFDLLPSVLVENNYIAGSTPLEQRPALCNPIMPAQVLIPPGDTAALARAIREIPYYDQMTIVLAAGSTYSFAAPDDRSSWPAYLAALPRLSGNFIVEGNGATLTRTGSEPFRLLVAIGSGTGTGTGTFRNLTLENGHSQQDGGAMYLSSGQFGLENVTFRQNRSDNEGEAVAVEHISSSLFTSTSLTVVNSFFEGNGDGLGQVLALGGQDVALDITGSQFRNNPAEALLLPSSVNRPVQVRQTCFMNGQPALPQRDWSTGTVLNLTGNWWHAADGPSGSGPGSGDSVPPGVTFSPYLTEPPAHCQDLQVPDITQAVVSESPVALVLRPIGGRAPLTYSLTPPTAGGTVTGTAPNLTFTPAANFVGVVSFTYTVTDANNRTDTGTVTLDVLGQGVITVTSTAQEVPFVTNGNCTLGEAIHAANTSTAVDACPAGRGLDVIRLQNATYTLQNFHTADASTQTGLPIISSNMVIEGGSGTVIQRAADAPQFRLLLVNSAGSLTLRRLTLRGGSLSTADTTFGGAISAAGPLTLDSVTISDSSAFYGGAISFIASDGTVALNISNSTFTGHEARQGGALFVCGTTSITGSTFSDNTANIGGALVTCNDETMPVTITGSHLVNNVATQNPTQNNPYGGGSAIFSMGGRISITGSVLRDTPDSTLTLIDTSKANMPRTNMPLTITGSCVIGHSIYGLQMHLEDNWWGSSSGAGGFYSGHGTPILPGNMHPFFITTYTRFLTASILGCPVQPVRPQPQTLTTPPHVPLNLQLTAIDGRPPYTFTVIAPPANGTLSGTPPALTYVADSGTDYVTFQVRDAAGNVAEASITIHVPLPLRLSLPDLPLLPGTSSLPLNHNLPANLLLPVEGGVGPFTAVIVTAPQQGTATLAPQTDALRLTYTPAAGFSGRDTLSVRVTDALGSSTALVVPLEVLPPVAVLDQQYRTAMGRPITVRPQLQHVVPALLPAATYYTVAPVGQPARGRLLIFNGVWTYFPPAGYLGTDTLQYRVSGPGGVLSVATITVEIVTLAALNPVSAPPVSLTTAPGVPITFSLTAAGGNTPYTFTLLTEPAHGTLSGTAPLFTYRSTGTTSVIETLRYRVTDSVGRTAENEISIDVREPLQAAALSVVALQAQTLPLKPPIRGGTPPYDLSIVVPPEQGELLETADGWLYIPGANFTGSEMIVYEVADADLDRDNSTIRITVAPLLLTAPANLALLPTTRPTFTWGAVTGIRSYVVQIAAEPDFATLAWQGVVNGTGYTLPQSLAQGRYFWRVAPLQSGVTQRWSPLAEFNIFIGTAPAAGAVHIGTTPVFTWQAVPGVRQYRLLVSADAQLTDPVVDITTTATTFRPPALAHGLYYWQVVPVDQTPLAGAVRRLLLTPPLPAAPVPSAPAAAALTAETRPELVWAAVTGAAEYELEVTAGSSFTRQPEVTTRVNALRYRLPALAAGAYSWRVRAINVFGAAGAWSAGRVFTIDTTPPAAPVLSSPAEAAIHNGVRPALTWTAAAEAVAFDVLLTTGATSTCEGTPVRVGNVRTYTPPAPLRQGLYRWCVRGYDAAGNAGPWSSPRTLTLNLLNSPADASVVTGTAPAVRFSWLAVPGVAAYTLQIARDADFSSAVTYTPGNVTAHTVVISGGEGLVYWRVTPAGSPPAAHAWRLNVTLVAPGRVALVGPANAFLTREQPTLRWNAVSGIERYEVQIARNSLFTAAVLPVQVSGLTLTTEMLPDGPLWWRVRALSAAGVPGAWSETRSLTLDTTPPAAPLPLAPAAGGVHQGLRPMLSWSAPAEVRRFEVILNAGTTCTAAPVSVNVSPYTAPAGLAQGLHAWCVRGYDAAGNAGPWSSPRLVTLSLLNAPAHQAVVVLPAGQTSARVTLTWLPVPGSTRFTVQVSPQPDLSNPTVYEVTGTSLVVTLPAGHYTWQVLPAGVAPADQVTRHFSVTPRLLAAPALLEPVSALLTRQPQTALRWSAVTGAQRYEVQLAGDATFTRAVRLLPADMPGLTLSHSSDGVVYWRVRGIDTWGAAGVWSAARTLTVDTTPPGVPVLLTPAAGSLLTTRTPAFTWQAAPGAAGYVIEIAADAGFQQTLVRARLSATQFTVPPALALRSGRHYWRVQAVDAAGNSSPVSVVGRFSIP